MGNFDSFEYDIKSRLPEWWKENALAFPVNQYTQDLISKILEELLSNTGVVQPLNVWKTIPEEYNWYHHYTELDDYLEYKNNDIILDNPVCKFPVGGQTIAYLPNTKRKCNAKIRLVLKGTDSKNKTTIDELILTNGNQKITFNNIPSVSTIEILTKTNQILIDGEENYNLVTGSFKYIEPNIKYDDYYNNDIDQHIDLRDENKETKITFETTDSVNFDLQVYLLKPTYTIEQNIRISTVSAFPIESVELYGYFCYPFNDQEGEVLLWEKKYEKRDRVVYDRITKQYDCERFYVKVKFHGIGTPLFKGFPQSEYDSNVAFQPNPHLDKWGKIYGLPRRYYRTDISEEEEPYTFPKYYNYPIEQDYWYEERMVNEYRFDEDAINADFIRDTELNNIAKLECIHPNMNEVWVFTETIDGDSEITGEITGISPYKIEELEETSGVSINDIELLQSSGINEPTIINPYNLDTIKLNDVSYKTKMFKCSFCLASEEHNIPKDIKIMGITLKFKTSRNLNSNSLRVSDESCMLLPFFSNLYDRASFDPTIEKIDISIEKKFWQREKDSLIIGEKDYLFGEEEITRDQLLHEGTLDFEIGFINDSDYLAAQLLLDSISLNIYYEIIPDEYEIDVKIPKRNIIIGSNDETCSVDITITNTGKKDIGEKSLYIILPPELKFISGVNHYLINIQEGESFTIPNIIGLEELRTGYYDILIFCDDFVKKEEILVRRSE